MCKLNVAAKIMFITHDKHNERMGKNYLEVKIKPSLDGKEANLPLIIEFVFYAFFFKSLKNPSLVLISYIGSQLEQGTSVRDDPFSQ